MAVVAVFQKAPAEDVESPIPDKGRLLLWSLAILDVMAVAWMLSAGDWLDKSSPVSAVVTLGGHHIVVMCLALVGFAMLAGLALLTKALTVARPVHYPFIAVGALVSVVALGGVLSVAMLIVGVVLLVALVGASFVSGRLVFLGSVFRRR